MQGWTFFLVVAVLASLHQKTNLAGHDRSRFAWKIGGGMINYGPATHTIRARTLTAAFARVRAFIEGYAEVTHATSGFGGNEPATLQQIAEALAELDESDPMAGVNGYTWTLEVALRSKPGPARSRSGNCRLGLLAHAGRLSLTVHLQLADSPDEVAGLCEALRATMGIRLAPTRLWRSRS